MTINEVVVGIAGQHIRSLQHSDYITRENADEVIDEEDIQTLINQVHKLVMLPGEEIIHVLPQEYKVDGQAEIKEPIGMYGGHGKQISMWSLARSPPFVILGAVLKVQGWKWEKLRWNPSLLQMPF